MSNQFDQERLQLNKKYAHLSRVDLPEVLADKSSYGQTLYVPPIARWNDEYVNDKNELVPALKNRSKISGSALISQALDERRLADEHL